MLYKSSFLEVQSQRMSQKRAVKKISFFELQNAFFFIFLQFEPLLLSTLVTLNAVRAPPEILKIIFEL
jgi:hypothetical protein